MKFMGLDPDERYGWKAVVSGSEAVIVTNESRDLNTAMVFSDNTCYVLGLSLRGFAQIFL